MNKFWKWMKIKEYSKYREDENKYYINWDYDEFTKQMLIGYMIEYLIEHNELIIEISKEYFIYGYRNIDTVYKQLENLINKNIKAERV